jgi:hypothetical protein
MQRYLVIDTKCSLCIELARATCNETKEWIDGVFSLRDSTAREMLSAGGHADLWQPALVEIESHKTRVYAGLRLRWRLLLALGPARTWRLGRSLAGEIMKAPTMKEEPSGLREVAHAKSRRRFVAALGSAVTMLSVLTGLGFPRKAFARAGSSRRSDNPFGGWLAQLHVGESTPVTPHELPGLWAEYQSSGSMRTLLASTHLQAYSDIASVRQAVREVTHPADFRAVRHAVEDGRTLNAIGLQRGSLMLFYYSLKAPGTLEPTRTRLLLLKVVDATESRLRVRVLAKIEDGTPTFLVPGSVPGSANSEGCDTNACQEEHESACWACMCTDWDIDWSCLGLCCSACAPYCFPFTGWCVICLGITCPWCSAEWCDNVCVTEECVHFDPKC